MFRFISLLPLLLVTGLTYAQITSPACNYDYGTTVQNAGGLIQWTTSSCSNGLPNAIGAVPFPTGTPLTLSPWMNVEGPPAYTGNISPLQDQPELYVVCGKDNLGLSTADFVLATTGATEFGGLHVGWYTPQGSFGNELEINVVDSLMLKELWVVEGATVDINGPVFITRECHNAGTININPGGSLTFLVDRTLHQSATFENKGTVNGKVNYEVIYLSGPRVPTWGAISGTLPQSMVDSLDPIVADLTIAEWGNYFSDNYTTFDNAGTVEFGITFSGYHTTGIPLSGVRLNPYDGDVTQKARFKGWNNNAGGFYWAGNIEDQLNSISNTNFTLVTTANGDTVVFDSSNPETVQDLLLDTSLYNNGLFYNLNNFFDQDDLDNAQELFNNAADFTWVGWGDYVQGTGWPNSFATHLIWNDMRSHSTLGNPVWINSDHSIIQDSTGVNPFNLHTGAVRPLIIEEMQPYYPEGWRQRSALTPSTSTNSNDRFLYGQTSTVDANTPVHVPVGQWLAFAGSQFTPIIWEYSGYPWLNSSDANDGSFYDELPYENQQIPIYQNPVDNEYDIYLVADPATQYMYNINGNLMLVDEYETCLVTNDETYCQANTQTYEIGELGSSMPVVCTESSINTGTCYETPDGDIYSPRINAWTFISNPANGYLDFNKVAETYFQDHPETNHIEFAWYCPTAPLGYWDIANPQFVNSPYQTLVKRFWRRKYHRVGETTYDSELDLWINLLVEFLEDNPYTQNDIIQTFIDDYATDSIINGSVALNYVGANGANPYRYYELGRYAAPGSAFWVSNHSPSSHMLNINSDQAIYDFDFPQETPGYLIAGDYNIGGRLASDSASYTLVMSVDYLNDTTYWPKTFFYLEYKDDAENGFQNGEDDIAYDTYSPFLFSDSSDVVPYTWAYHNSPNNYDPMMGTIPEPDSAFMITPLLFQDISDFDGPPTRIGIRTHSQAGTVTYDNGDVVEFTDSITPITYLGEGDTLWFRKRDFKYPVTVEVLMTNTLGDFNGDGVVSAADLLDFFTAYEDCATDIPVNPELQTYDLDQDGCVDVNDYLVVLQNLELSINKQINTFAGVSVNLPPPTPQQVADTYPDFSAEPDVLITGPSIEIPNQTISIYTHDNILLDTRQNQVFAPYQGVFILVTERDRVGMVDLRP